MTNISHSLFTVVMVALGLFALWAWSISWLEGTRRPIAPRPFNNEWYRGWECGFEYERATYLGTGYTAYKGGCDLDAIYVEASTWTELLDAIDEWEEYNG